MALIQRNSWEQHQGCSWSPREQRSCSVGTLLLMSWFCLFAAPLQGTWEEASHSGLQHFHSPGSLPTAFAAHLGEWTQVTEQLFSPSSPRSLRRLELNSCWNSWLLVTGTAVLESYPADVSAEHWSGLVSWGYSQSRITLLPSWSRWMSFFSVLQLKMVNNSGQINVRLPQEKGSYCASHVINPSQNLCYLILSDWIPIYGHWSVCSWNIHCYSLYHQVSALNLMQ